MHLYWINEIINYDLEFSWFFNYSFYGLILNV